MNDAEKRVLRTVLKSEIIRHFKTDVPDSVIDRVWNYFFSQHVFIRRPLDPYKVIRKFKEMDKKHGEYYNDADKDEGPIHTLPEMDVDEK